MLLNSYLYKKSIRNNNNYKNHNYFLSLVPKINIDSLGITHISMTVKSIEKTFKVNVVKINTINLKGKTKTVKGKKVRKSDLKKAIVTLKKGQSIDLTTGI